MLRSLLAGLSLVSLVGLVHCSSASTRSGFAEETKDAGAVHEGGAPKADPAAGFDTADAGPIKGDDAMCTQDIDVVLVLDVSSSMGFILDKLGSEIAGVVDAANKLKAGAHFGIVGYADNGAFGLGGAEGDGKVHTKATTLKKAFADFKSLYTGHNRNPGDGPTGPETQNPICEENSLDALFMAAADFPWRAAAARVILVVTDDTFLEGGDNYGDRDGDGDTTSTDYPREGDYPAVHSYDDTIKAIKDAKARVFSVTRIGAGGGGGGIFGGLGGGSSCGTGRRHASAGDSSITFGWTKPFDGDKAPIPKQTDGKNFDLDGVRSGKISLSDTINEVVLETHCAGDPPK